MGDNKHEVDGGGLTGDAPARGFIPLSHIGTDPPFESDSGGRKMGHKVVLYPSGARCTYTVQGTRAGRRGGGIRGGISGFSSASQNRMQRKLALVPWGRLLARRRAVYWLSLTTGDKLVAREFKVKFKALYTRVLRRWPCALFWRLEYQPKRGAAHFHALVVFDGEGPTGFLAWLVEAWGELTGSPPQAVHGRWVTSWPRLVKYLSDAAKYRQSIPPVNVETGEVDCPGRFWGAVGGITRYMGRCVTVWGREAWASGRRVLTRLVAGARSQRRKTRWRVGFAFLADVAGFARWLGPGAGPARVQGLDSVCLPWGGARVWERESWAV